MHRDRLTSTKQNEKRALTIALGNELAYVVQALAPNFVWKTTAFPKATKGLSWTIGLSTLLIFWTFFTLYLIKRDKILAARTLDTEVNSEVGIQGQSEGVDRGDSPELKKADELKTPKGGSFA